MTKNFWNQIHSLNQATEPFAIATVVRCENPTSAKPGAKAIITANGALRGWIGGACAEQIVRQEAMKALNDGKPRFLRIGPSVSDEVKFEAGGIEFLSFIRFKITTAPWSKSEAMQGKAAKNKSRKRIHYLHWCFQPQATEYEAKLTKRGQRKIKKPT